MLKELEVKSFITSLQQNLLNTVKGGNSGLPDCEDAGQPTDCGCPDTGTGTGTATYTQVPACPVSYPQIVCDGGPYGTALCTN